VNVDGGTARQLTHSQPAATERALVTPQKVSYRSDSLTIAAYLYTPPAAAPGQRFPGILYIHGGPTGQFSDNFQYQAQFLARMGYVVLAPNIRGSSGYGFAFEKANDPCWTICDLRDVAAGVEFLKARHGHQLRRHHEHGRGRARTRSLPGGDPAVRLRRLGVVP
jgi:dipeptidyl aminopeptidase/acylaminoacyl peptidase